MRPLSLALLFAIFDPTARAADPDDTGDTANPVFAAEAWTQDNPTSSAAPYGPLVDTTWDVWVPPVSSLAETSLTSEAAEFVGGLLVPDDLLLGDVPHEGLAIEGNLLVPDPNDPESTLVFIQERSTSPVAGVVGWKGHSPTTEGDHLSLFRDGDLIAGWMSAGGDEYELHGHLGAPLKVERVPLSAPSCGTGTDLPVGADASKNMKGSATALGGGAAAAAYAPGDGDTWYDDDAIVLDFLFVYNSTSLSAMTNAGTTPSLLVSTIVDRMAQSWSDSVIFGAGSTTVIAPRVLAIEQVTWTEPASICQARIDMADTTKPIGQTIAARRDAVGADLVISMLTTDNQGFGGCAYAPTVVTARTSTSIGSSDRFTGSVLVGAQNWVLGHEVGHLLGNQHFRNFSDPNAQAGDQPANWELNPSGGGPSYSFGHVTTLPAGTLSCPVLPRVFCDIMASAGSTCNQFRIQFSNPNVNFQNTGCNPTRPSGTTTPACTTSGGVTACRTAESARRISETAPLVTTYRDPLPVFTGAALTDPLPGSLITGSTSTVDVPFGWTSGGGTAWVLEVQDVAGTYTFRSDLLPTPDATVLGIPTDQRVLKVRLWTQAASYQWSHREYRLNTKNRFHGCSEDPSVIPPGSSAAADPCGGTTPICSYVSTAGSVTCDLEVVQGSSSGHFNATSAPTGTKRLYDLMVFGTAETGDDFCCMMSDLDDDVQSILVNGTSGADSIWLGSSTSVFGPWNSFDLSVEVAGRAGNDTISGSYSTDSGYDELLRGMNGADWINGRDGNDELRGGDQQDELWGGNGNDVLIAGPGSDMLMGQVGWDVLCTSDATAVMWGSDFYTTSEVNTIYISSTATGTVSTSTTPYSNPATCGHSSKISGITLCNQTTTNIINTAPPSCAAAGIPN